MERKSFSQLGSWCHHPTSNLMGAVKNSVKVWLKGRVDRLKKHLKKVCKSTNTTQLKYFYKSCIQNLTKSAHYAAKVPRLCFTIIYYFLGLKLELH